MNTEKQSPRSAEEEQTGYRYPLFKKLNEHGLLLLDSELDEIIDTVNEMQTKAEIEAMQAYASEREPGEGYWQKRCEAAESLLKSVQCGSIPLNSTTAAPKRYHQ